MDFPGSTGGAAQNLLPNPLSRYIGHSTTIHLWAGEETSYFIFVQSSSI